MNSKLGLPSRGLDTRVASTEQQHLRQSALGIVAEHWRAVQEDFTTKLLERVSEDHCCKGRILLLCPTCEAMRCAIENLGDDLGDCGLIASAIERHLRGLELEHVFRVERPGARPERRSG